MSKRLAMIYLANDILQNSRKKGAQFVVEFYHKLPTAIQQLVKQGDGKVSRLATHRKMLQSPLSGRQLSILSLTSSCLFKWKSPDTNAKATPAQLNPLDNQASALVL